MLSSCENVLDSYFMLSILASPSSLIFPTSMHSFMRHSTAAVRYVLLSLDQYQKRQLHQLLELVMGCCMQALPMEQHDWLSRQILAQLVGHDKAVEAVAKDVAGHLKKADPSAMPKVLTVPTQPYSTAQTQKEPSTRLLDDADSLTKC